MTTDAGSADVTSKREPTSLQIEIRQLANLLPQQGPITSFAFVNPLQGLEEFPFYEALRRASRIYRCETFLSESQYRRKLSEGSVSVDDLREVLEEEFGAAAGELTGGILPRTKLLLSILQHQIMHRTEQELNWFMAESDSLQTFSSFVEPEIRDRLRQETRNWVMREFPVGQASVDTGEHRSAEHHSTAVSMMKSVIGKAGGVFHVVNTPERLEQCYLNFIWNFSLLRAKENRSEAAPQECPENEPGVRHRDLLLAVTSADADGLVHKILVRFCAVFLDQGYAQWTLPHRASGFLASFCTLFEQFAAGKRRWMRPLADEIRMIRAEGMSASASIETSLQLLGIGIEERVAYLRNTMLALRGWAGMIWQTESSPDRAVRGSPPGTLLEFMAVRLLLDRLAVAYLARETLGFTGPLRTLRGHLRQLTPVSGETSFHQRDAFAVLQLAQLHGWGPQTLAELDRNSWKGLIQEISRFTETERRRVFHQAMERGILKQTLSAVKSRAALPHVSPDSPQLQVVTCIDAREESFRRHLEELAPDVETFGHAGFFCVPMYYRGVAEARFTALCPVVMRPQHWVVEDVIYSQEELGRRLAVARRLLGRLRHRFDSGTRGSFAGAILTAAVGPLASVPLLGRVLFPGLTAKMQSTARRFVAPPGVTRLRLERAEGMAAGPHDDGIGFTLSEMVGIAERALRDIGLTGRFAPLVVFLGHGSGCLNNPHESAYHCGACSGNAGGPNARALAAMLNDVRVRRSLKERGLDIPEETYFVGALHNTASEEITFFDLELLPTWRVRSLRLARHYLSRAAERNAHERCRRFESADPGLTESQALLHVQERAEDLAQTRPEYGNCTNAICFVGRRSRLRGLYLDRRAFLMSYDPTQDTSDFTILARILNAVIPVCEGINMLYTLSAIDNRGWGAGTKLPHNVTSLLGVMDGAASDLRFGLPWQGVDIHQPVRLLFVVEASAEAVLHVIRRNPLIDQVCRNEWIRLAVLDPDAPSIKLFRNGGFQSWAAADSELPVVESSFQWYHGQRDHLRFAMIRENEHRRDSS